MAVGLAVRAFFVLKWHPALIGYPDSANYMLSAQGALFGDTVRVAGYVEVLKVLHWITPRLVLVTIVQHILGVISGLLMYDCVRRVGLPRALGLVPAAIVILGGSSIILEHTILSDPVYLFLDDLAMWCVVCAWSRNLWFAFAAGVALGAAIDVRTVGLEVAPFGIAGLMLATADGIRIPRILRRWTTGKAPAARWQMAAAWRLSAIAVAIGGVAVAVVPYLVAHQAQTGTVGFTTFGNSQLYGRVATFADCHRFTPPPDTRNLCPTQPVSQRLGSQTWIFGLASPIHRVYGLNVQPHENNRIESFALAAIEGEPITYLEYVGRGLVRYIDPAFSASPYSAVGNRGANFGPDHEQDNYFETANVPGVEKLVDHYYRDFPGRMGNVSVLLDWSRLTRIQGPVMVIALLLMLVAVFLASGAPRRLAIFFAMMVLVLLIGPVAVLDYNYRFAIPAFGPLAASAAIGGFEITRRIRARWPGARARPGLPGPSAGDADGPGL